MLGDGDDLFIHRALGDEAVHGDFLRLTESMTPVLSLAIDLRVKIAVMKDDGVGAGEV